MERLVELFHWLVYAHISLVVLFAIGAILWIVREIQSLRSARKWDSLPAFSPGIPLSPDTSEKEKLQEDYTKSMGEFAQEMVKELKGRRKEEHPWEGEDLDG